MFLLKIIELALKLQVVNLSVLCYNDGIVKGAKNG